MYSFIYTILTWNCCGTNRKLRNWKGIHSCQLARTAENHSYKSRYIMLTKKSLYTKVNTIIPLGFKGDIYNSINTTCWSLGTTCEDFPSSVINVDKKTPMNIGEKINCSNNNSKLNMMMCHEIFKKKNPKITSWGHLIK